LQASRDSMFVEILNLPSGVEAESDHASNAWEQPRFKKRFLIPHGEEAGIRLPFWLNRRLDALLKLSSLIASGRGRVEVHV